jgi:hypothetical protein
MYSNDHWMIPTKVNSLCWYDTQDGGHHWTKLNIGPFNTNISRCISLELTNHWRKHLTGRLLTGQLYYVQAAIPQLTFPSTTCYFCNISIEQYVPNVVQSINVSLLVHHVTYMILSINRPLRPPFVLSCV